MILIGAACRDSSSSRSVAVDSAQAVAVAFRLAGPERSAGLQVLSFARDTGGYLILLGPPLVEIGPKGDTMGVNVGGRVEIRVRGNGAGTVLYRGQ